MKEKGQSLIEVLVALGVSVIIITAIVMSVVLAIVNAQFAKSQNLATSYARQGMELIRQLSRSNWTAFNNYSNTDYCLGSNNVLEEKALLPNGECPKNVGNFIREVQIDHNSDSCQIAQSPANYGSKVTVTIYWNDSKCGSDSIFCHQVGLDSCLQNINAVPTP